MKLTLSEYFQGQVFKNVDIVLGSFTIKPCAFRINRKCPVDELLEKICQPSQLLLDHGSRASRGRKEASFKFMLIILIFFQLGLHPFKIGERK